MGATNVTKVFTYWTHLEHRDARGLAYMANVSIDQHTPPIYFGGWEAVARALGHDAADKPENARRAAVRVIAALSKAGALVSSGQARPGVRAEYALALDPKVTFVPKGQGRNVTWEEVPRTTEPETAIVPRRETASVPPPETQNVAPPETVTVPTWDSYGPEPETAPDPPRKEPQEQHQEQLNEYGEKTTIKSAVNSPTRTQDDAQLIEIGIHSPSDEKRLQDRADAIRADTPTSIDAERVRQSRALMKMQAEYERNLALEGTAP